jgi:hypothetical protein
VNSSRLDQTENTLAVTDRLWRAEMCREFGADAVLIYGFGQERQGKPGTRLRHAFEARAAAVSAWRVERHRSVGPAA